MKTDEKAAIQEQLKKKKDQIQKQAKKVELGLITAEISRKSRNTTK